MSARAVRRAPPAAAAAAFLGVEQSFTGRRWQARLEDERQAFSLVQRFSLTELGARILAGRGIGIEDAGAALSATLRDNLRDPSRLCDMDRAAHRLADAVIAGEAVCVFGDYDVDGATSAALLQRLWASLGQPMRLYVPDRLTEGYGPNAPAMARLAEAGVRLVVTVDCGTLAFAALEAARAHGLDVVVVDHHQAEASLPPAHAVVNPNRLDDESGEGTLAAVGVAFLLAIALVRELRGRGYFMREGRTEPDLRHLLDLVALGTVCDVVPLRGLNRSFVAQGLKVMRQTTNVGLRALAVAAGLDRPPTAYHLGFLLGPRVNAGGRVGEASLGARLLATEDSAEAERLARHLDALNRERQAIEAAVLEEAIECVERGAARSARDGAIVAAGEGWHPGVVGVVASRLKERYGRPAFVIGLEGERGRGSGRSIDGVDLGRAVRALASDGLLLAGGGHAMAAGLTVARSALPAFRAALDQALGAELAACARHPVRALDGLWSGHDGPSLLTAVEALGPYGAGFPEPVFALPDARLHFIDGVGSDHVAIGFETPSGTRARAIAFRAAGEPLGHGLAAARGERLHLAVKLKAGRRAGVPDLLLEDAALPAN